MKPIMEFLYLALDIYENTIEYDFKDYLHV